ncbi:MAG TPA: hypothetical protein VHT28_16820 [Silvibacterium sp.]|nr:hypothetical protein [Silvibacterium sp.]
MDTGITRLIAWMIGKNCGGQYTTLWVWPVLIIGVPLYLYVNLFAFPNIPFLLGGDQVYFWTGAQRMLHGELIYQDFFGFTPPGTDLFYLAWFKLFGPHLWVTNVVVLLLGVALCWVCFSISKLLMELDLALLSTLIFLVLIYGSLLNATHHWFSLLAVMCAIRVLMPQRTSLRIAIAGGLLGLASFFTQTAGVMCVLALLLLFAWEGYCVKNARQTILGYQLLLIAVFGVVLSALNAYFIAKIGWKQLWALQVVYPHYQAYWFGRFFPGLPEPLRLQRLPHLAPYLFVYGLLPVVYPLVLWYCWRERCNPKFENGMQLTLLSLVGLALLLEIIPAVNWLRVYTVSMPGVILAVWAATRTNKLRPYVAVAGYILVVCLASQQVWSKYNRDDRTIQLPAGKTVLSAQKYEQYFWIMKNTKPGDFFLAASWPGIYLPLALRSPMFAETLLNSEWTRPEYVELAVQQVDRKQVKYVLWSPRLDHPDDPTRPWEDHLGPFRSYLKSRYRRVHVFSNDDEVWERE